MLEQDKPFWLTRLLGTLSVVIVAYVVAVFLELILLRIADMPRGPLWVPQFHLPFLFIMTAIVVGLLSIPYWMKEWDPGLRTFSMFSSAFLGCIAVLTQTGAFNPIAPLVLLSKHVIAPLGRVLGLHTH
jgi:hypothetical protein